MIDIKELIKYRSIVQKLGSSSGDSGSGGSGSDWPEGEVGGTTRPDGQPAAGSQAGSKTIEPLEITENGTYTASDNVAGYSPVTVNVPAPEITLQDKTVTENGTYEADSGFDGLGTVTVNVPVDEVTVEARINSYINAVLEVTY